MKNKRIVASLHKVQVPADRKEAMLNHILAQVDAQAASDKKEQEMKIEHRVNQKNRMPQGRIKKAKRWPLVLVACLLLTITLVACIPEARAAVSEWITKMFSTQDYMGKESCSRSPEPALEAVITQVENDGGRVQITELQDSAKARMLAEGFGVKLDEVAYIGDKVYISGWFTGTSGKFLLDQWTGGDTWSENGDWLEGDMSLTMPDGTVWSGVLNPHFTDEMNAVMGEAIDVNEEKPLNKVYAADGTFLTSHAKADALWYKWLETNDVRFTFEAHPIGADAPTLAGQGSVKAKLSFRQYYLDMEHDAVVPLFQADLGIVTIDTDAYSAGTETSDINQSVTLSGIHRMLIMEWEHRGVDQNGFPKDAYLHQYVEDLDMSGVTVTVESVAFTPTGPEIALRLDLPADWTRAARVAAAQGGKHGGIHFNVYLDGKLVEYPFRMIQAKGNADFENKDDPFLSTPRVYSESTIPPSEWENIRTITIEPATNWPTERYVVEVGSEKLLQPVTQLEPGVDVVFHVNYESGQSDGWQEDRMPEYAITIHLDDYR